MDRASLPPAVAELVKHYPVIVTTMVAWGEMDANSHVNNAVYFRYIEHARLKYFHDLEFWQTQQETGIGPILAWTDCRFRRPLSYPDDVTIATRMSEVSDDKFTMDTIVVSHRLGDTAAIGQQKLVAYDYRQHKKAPLPEIIKQRIEAIEKPFRP